VSESLVPVRSVMELLNQELADADERFAALVAEDPIVKRLSERGLHHGDRLRRGAR